jgi:hypothetical protein
MSSCTYVLRYIRLAANTSGVISVSYLNHRSHDSDCDYKNIEQRLNSGWSISRRGAKGSRRKIKGSTGKQGLIEGYEIIRLSNPFQFTWKKGQVNHKSPDSYDAEALGTTKALYEADHR